MNEGGLWEIYIPDQAIVPLIYQNWQWKKLLIPLFFNFLGDCDVSLAANSLSSIILLFKVTIGFFPCPFNIILLPKVLLIFEFGMQGPNLHNCLFNNQIQEDLQVYLEGLAADVQSNVWEHPFGWHTITNWGSSWKYYEQITNKIKKFSAKAQGHMIFLSWIISFWWQKELLKWIVLFN